MSQRPARHNHASRLFWCPFHRGSNSLIKRDIWYADTFVSPSCYLLCLSDFLIAIISACNKNFSFIKGRYTINTQARAPRSARSPFGLSCIVSCILCTFLRSNHCCKCSTVLRVGGIVLARVILWNAANGANWQVEPEIIWLKRQRKCGFCNAKQE